MVASCQELTQTERSLSYKPWNGHTEKHRLLLLLMSLRGHRGHVTPPHSCAIQAFTSVTYQWEHIYFSAA
jgi:hypothetical protein